MEDGVCTLVVTPPPVDPFVEFCNLPGNWDSAICSGGGGDDGDDDNDGGGGGGSDDGQDDGDENENQPDAAWKGAANQIGGCIHGRVSDLSIIPDNKLEIRWETIGGDGAYSYVEYDRFGKVLAYVAALDFDVLHSETVGPNRRASRDAVLYERISHELVHLWKLAKSKGEDDWSGHGGAFFQTLDSFRIRSRACD